LIWSQSVEDIKEITKQKMENQKDKKKGATANWASLGPIAQQQPATPYPFSPFSFFFPLTDRWTPHVITFLNRLPLLLQPATISPMSLLPRALYGLSEPLL
jgi:hypothetical protein